MMKRQTVEQLLLVFRLFRESYDQGRSLHKAYQNAVRDVADRHAVTYQTIGDGCRRRLRLGNIRELYALLARWVENDPAPLAKQMKDASDPSAHDDIAAFFGSPTKFAGARHRDARPAALARKIDTFSVHLPEQSARMVRALAEMEGISPSVLLGHVVEPAVEEKMKRAAQAILRDTQAGHRMTMNREEIQGILRDHEAELRGLGAEHVSIFGSAARGDAGPASDVDLAVTLKPEFSQGGFDYFGRFEELRTRLANILVCPVDLVEEPVERDSLQAEINKDRVLAF